MGWKLIFKGGIEFDWPGLGQNFRILLILLKILLILLDFLQVGKHELAWEETELTSRIISFMCNHMLGNQNFGVD